MDLVSPSAVTCWGSQAQFHVLSVYLSSVTCWNPLLISKKTKVSEQQMQFMHVRMEVGDGWGELEREGEGWQRMNEKVGWSVWLRKQGSACACMCVCLCASMHACMWLEDSAALVHMLDSPFAGSVATVVLPWRHCHLLLH